MLLNSNGQSIAGPQYVTSQRHILCQQNVKVNSVITKYTLKNTSMNTDRKTILKVPVCRI